MKTTATFTTLADHLEQFDPQKARIATWAQKMAVTMYKLDGDYGRMKREMRKLLTAFAAGDRAYPS